MEIILRKGTPADAQVCGTICYEAFKTISENHNFPPDFPEVESAIGLMNYIFSQNTIFSVVAEADGKIAGSNFLWEDGFIGGVGPITIDTKLQNSGIGRKLMEAVLKRAEEKNLAGVRLLQAAYHNRSLSLYTKLGFDIREPISVIQGNALNFSIPGYEVRQATENDVEECSRLSKQLLGHERKGDLHAAISAGSARVVLKNANISGYTTGVGFFGHTVTKTNYELKALISTATSFPGPGFLLPSGNSDVLRWCLSNGLKVIQPMSLMTLGLYNQPAGAYLPSVLY